MPKLWNETIETHREAVIDSIFATTERLMQEEGMTALTMSRIAVGAGIGRATLYKYFGDVNAVLLAWHERVIADHLRTLHRANDHPSPRASLEHVLLAYAEISRKHHGHALANLLHGLPHVRRAQDHLRAFVQQLIQEAARRGDVRIDVSSAELSSFAVAALAAADQAQTKAGIRRLVMVILQALAPLDRSE